MSRCWPRRRKTATAVRLHGRATIGLSGQAIDSGRSRSFAARERKEPGASAADAGAARQTVSHGILKMHHYSNDANEQFLRFYDHLLG